MLCRVKHARLFLKTQQKRDAGCHHEIHLNLGGRVRLADESRFDIWMRIGIQQKMAQKPKRICLLRRAVGWRKQRDEEHACVSYQLFREVEPAFGKRLYLSMHSDRRIFLK